MADLEDVSQVRLVPTRPRFGEAHVTKTACYLRQILSSYLRVALPGHAVVGEETIEVRFAKGLAADQVDGGFAEDAHVPGRVEGVHGIPSHANLSGGEPRETARGGNGRSSS